MDEVRFTTARPASPCISVVSADTYPKVFVALGNHLQSFSCEVHWLAQMGRSVPHLEHDCPHCSLPMISKTYVPSAICPLSFGRGVMDEPRLPMLAQSRIKPIQWQRKVVELPPSGMMLATTLERGTLFAICRQAGRNPKKVIYRIFENEVDWAALPDSFDVRPILFKTWGVGTRFERN
jgi:hypothetical protein